MLEILSEQNSVRDAAAWLASCSRLLIARPPPGALQWPGEAGGVQGDLLCPPSPSPLAPLPRSLSRLGSAAV